MNSAIELFQKHFNFVPSILGIAPGRLEILGNHTDYNEGFVLSAAVSQKTEFAARPTGGKKCRLVSAFDEKIIEFDLDNLNVSQSEKCWTDYIKGLICEIRKRGSDIGAFDAAVSSDVPLSAGMSSSAALEISALFAFRKLFDLKFSDTELAKIGQGAENNYVGVKSGLLDQFSSINGKRNNLILCDFRKNEVLRNVAVPEGYVIVVFNSMVKHTLVESDYNVRRESCMSALNDLRRRYPQIKALRDITIEMLEAAREELAFIDYRRALHVVSENDRVMKAVSALESSDMQAFGNLLYESHESSRVNFENSCPELDYLIELSRSVPGCIGARLSGGGFGGITIHFVRKELAKDYARKVATAYKIQTGNVSEPIFCELGDGASSRYLQ